MKFNRTTIRTLSILGQRGAFGYALTELAKEKEDIIALTADLCTTSGLDRFKNAYPDRVVNVGIAEQNLVGVAAGMSALGYVPFATTFSNFASLRSCEQIRHFMGYMKENVKIVGFGGGFAMGMFGITHYGMEDIAAIRSIPNLVILSPADCLEAAKAVVEAYHYPGPVYLRLTGVMNQPMVYMEDYEFEIGKMIPLKEGEDIAIFATGGMVHSSLLVAKALEEQGISCKVINVTTIKPLDLTTLQKALKVKLLVTVEEHSIIGGLGSSISEALSELSRKPPQLLIGISGEYKKAGSFDYMLEQYGLTKDDILHKIIEKYKEVN